MQSCRSLNTPKDILKQHWGFDSFRLKQEEIIASVLAGNDTLALLPTGGGKSICFQLPALCSDGMCLVISPLLALMHDQVQHLRSKKIHAYAITSFMTWREMDIVLDNCAYGQVKFLYISPERLKNETFLERLKKMKINLIAVDEAHCISQWGYDFRPPYLEIAEVREIIQDVPILALTATATPVVVKDIQEKLKFKTSHVISSSFVRKNLAYVVIEKDDKLSKMLEIAHKVPGCGIIYCGTRLRTKEISNFMNKRGISSVFYNAGMLHKERVSAQEKWFRGAARVMCATNAFGMGIDKPDVRFVVHADVPGNIENYFQEAGRAGRDGKKAYAVLLHNNHDLVQLEKKVSIQFPPIEFIRKVYRSIASHLQVALGAGEGVPFHFNLNAVCKTFNLEYSPAYYAIQILERAGYLSFNESVFEPSRLHFTISRIGLYDFQVSNPSLDSCIKLLLRMYGGLFESYVNIKEEDIAGHGKMEEKDVYAKLAILKQHGIIDYVKRSDEPRLSFVLPRVSEQHLTIPDTVYANRKKAEEVRIHAMQKFLGRQQCRSIQLLEYFGESNAEPCNRCDVCNAQKSHGFSHEEYAAMDNALTEVVMRKAISIEELDTHVTGFPTDKLITLVRWKLEKGELLMNHQLNLVIPDGQKKGQ